MEEGRIVEADVVAGPGVLRVGTVGVAERALGRGAIEPLQAHRLLDPPLGRTREANAQRVRVVAQHDHPRAAEDDRVAAGCLLPDGLLGGALEVPGIGDLPRHGHRVAGIGADESAQESLDQAGLDLGVVGLGIFDRDLELLSDGERNGPVDERDAQPLRHARRDPAAPGSVRGGDGHQRHGTGTRSGIGAMSL